MGLGLLGQITLQLSRAMGYQAIGLDLDPRKIEFATKQGFLALHPDDSHLTAMVAKLTAGEGVDATLITAGSPNSGEIFEFIAPLCRDRANVVAVGDVKMDLLRRTYFKKELTVLQSRSYGPGRYDPAYEIQGKDYPIGNVRWTENRNMQYFLELLANKKLNMQALTTHDFPFANVVRAYELVMSKRAPFSIGILLKYDFQQPLAVDTKTNIPLQF